MMSTTTQPDAWARDLLAAMEAGDLDGADALLAARQAPPPAETVGLVVDLHLRRHRFADAVALIDATPADRHDPTFRFKRHLGLNLQAMRQTRPRLLHELLHEQQMPLVGLNPIARYRLAPGKDNVITIADVSDPAAPMLLSPHGDPSAMIHSAVAALPTGAAAADIAIALCGIGDGYLLNYLARTPPQLFMDQQQTIHLLEPDIELLALCLALHDYSGDTGPIRQDRVQWHVGPACADTLLSTLLDQPYLPPPGCVITQGRTGEQIKTDMQQRLVRYNSHCARLQERINARDEQIDRQQLIELLGPEAPRRPRIALLTSRFTTVLQYATRDAAEAFERIGFDTTIVIEAQPHHRMMRLAVQRAIDEFRPDLVFQIDHLRNEQPGIYPPNTPFICWIQDLLTNLTSETAGASVGDNDFVLTFASPLFIDAYGYPPQQCIDMPMMLTLEHNDAEPDHDASCHGRSGRADSPAPAAEHGRDGRGTRSSTTPPAPDIVYVSNVSSDPATLADQLAAQCQPTLRPILQACAKQMIDTYAAGRSLPTMRDISDLLDEHTARSGLAPDEALRRRMIDALWHPLNITLYRQQALRWAIDAAETLGLRLGLFGRGWEDNPRFARFARGPIEHGQPLRDLTRRSRITLVLEPYPCFAHHRMLDALSAGGFALVRAHPSNTLMQELANFLRDHVPGDPQTADDALAAVAPRRLSDLRQLLRRAACLDFSSNDDPVRQVRCWQRAAVLIDQPAALPHLSDISFADADSCRSRIRRFAADAEARRRISAAQWANVRGRLTFSAGMARVVSSIRDRLAEQLRSQEAASAEPLHIAGGVHA